MPSLHLIPLIPFPSVYVTFALSIFGPIKHSLSSSQSLTSHWFLHWIHGLNTHPLTAVIKSFDFQSDLHATRCHNQICQISVWSSFLPLHHIFSSCHQVKLTHTNNHFHWCHCMLITSSSHQINSSLNDLILLITLNAITLPHNNIKLSHLLPSQSSHHATIIIAASYYW